MYICECGKPLNLDIDNLGQHYLDHLDYDTSEPAPAVPSYTGLDCVS